MSIVFIASADGLITGPDFEARCALGKGGVTLAETKREGDGASPIGAWPMRRVFYRPDRVAKPETGLQTLALTEQDGWCDDPEHPLYNRLVTVPFPASHEKLWREDHVYDLIVELGHNDDPPVPGMGSAIFMHLARPDYAPTEGCVALAEPDLRVLLRASDQSTIIEIAPSTAD
ncbi:MAG: L,D-transpeptidase family protein [Pseudomonadota bacterium]